jgi:hypothetical protein
MRGFRFEHTNSADCGTRTPVTTHSLQTGNRRQAPRNQGPTLARGYLATWVSSSWSDTYLLGWTQLCVPKDCQKNRTTDLEALHLTLTKNEKTNRSRIAGGNAASSALKMQTQISNCDHRDYQYEDFRPHSSRRSIRGNVSQFIFVTGLLCARKEIRDACNPKLEFAFLRQ